MDLINSMGMFLEAHPSLPNVLDDWEHCHQYSSLLLARLLPLNHDAFFVSLVGATHRAHLKTNVRVMRPIAFINSTKKSVHASKNRTFKFIRGWRKFESICTDWNNIKL